MVGFSKFAYIWFVLKTLEDYKADLLDAFYVGQSVRSYIIDVSELFVTEL